MDLTRRQPLRIGVFGGAFDPPHRAHEALARTAIHRLALDALRVIPTGQAWHRPARTSAAAHRVAMAQLAFASVPGAQVDDRETRRTGASYTVDTLRELQAEEPGVHWFLLIGEDQAVAFRHWRGWAEILQIATLVIAERDQNTLGTAEKEAEFAVLARQGELVRLQWPLQPLSATTIRRRVAAGEGIDDLVLPSVARYIETNHLYHHADD